MMLKGTNSAFRLKNVHSRKCEIFAFFMIFVENLKFIHLFIFVQNRSGKGVKHYSRTKQGIPDY